MSQEQMDLTGEIESPTDEGAVPDVPRPQYVQAAGDPAMAALRVSYDSLASMAAGKTREPREVIERVVGLLNTHEQVAELGAYSIPYKTHTDECKSQPWQARKNCRCPITWIHGPSIHLALAIASEWKYCVDGARVYQNQEDKGEALIEGFFFDLVNVRMVVRHRLVSRWRKGKGGQTYLIGADEYSKEVEREASKIHRNAILKGLPRYVVEPCYETALRIHMQNVQAAGVPEAWANTLGFFDRYRVGERELLSLLGLDTTDDVRELHIVHLRNLARNIRGGSVDVKQLFGMPDEDTQAVGQLPGATSEEREDD